MTLPSLSGFLVLLFLFLSFRANGQGAKSSVDRWASALSVKKNTDASSIKAVYDELISLDSTQLCQVITTLNELYPGADIRFKARWTLLERQLELKDRTCSETIVSLSDLQDAIQFAYELDDDWLKFELHRNLSVLYTSQLNFGSAAMHALSAIELAEAVGRDHLHVGAGGWYGLGYVLYHSREYEASIKASTISLSNFGASEKDPGDTLDLSYKMNALNTIGLCYQKLGKPDSAFLAFDQAMQIAGEVNNAFWKGIINGNRGDVYYQLGVYDSAKVLLTFDYDQSKAAQQLDNAATSLQRLASIELKRNQPQSALRMLRECIQLLKGMSRPEILEQILYTYTQTFAALDQADSMNVYMHRYLILHDSIEQAATENKLAIVRMRMDNQANVYKVVSLSKEKRKIALVRNFIIGFIFLLAITGYMILNKQKLKLKARRREALNEKQKAERDAMLAREQLEIYTRHLREKTNLVETLQDQLLRREVSEEQMQQISALSQHTILTEDDWEKFKSMFEKVYPGFFHMLRQQSPDITLAELRMAALCKLQVPAREAANLLGISPNSVNKTRQRLRSRLGLDAHEDLEVYFARM